MSNKINILLLKNKHPATKVGQERNACKKALIYLPGYGHMTGTMQLSLLDSVQLGEYSHKSKKRETTRSTNCVSHYNIK